MKKIFWSIVAAIVALAVIATIVIGVFLDRIVKKGIEVYGPQMTKVSVTVDAVHLSLLTGSAKVNGLVVGNPEDYKTPRAISVGTIAVGVDPMTVFSEKIVIRSIRLESPDITFEGGLGGNNLSKILDNVDSTEKNAPRGGTLSTNAAAQPKSVKKYEVDDLVITGAKVHVSLTGMDGQEMTLPLPEIHLTDLGKSGQGITATDLTRRVLAAITSSTIRTVANAATNLGQSAEKLKQAGQNIGGKISNGIDNLLKK
jgi:uncharacterized protein involved in outer membrane biogenesis